MLCGTDYAVVATLGTERLVELPSLCRAAAGGYCCRSDPGIILTAARFFGPQLALTGLVANKLTVRRTDWQLICLRQATVWSAYACARRQVSQCARMARNALFARMARAGIGCSCKVHLLTWPAVLWSAQGPFSAVVDKHVTDPWLRSMLDLECFVLSGMLAKDTLTAGEYTCS